MYIIKWNEGSVEYNLQSINPFAKTTNESQAKQFTEQQKDYAQGVADSLQGQHPEFESVHIFTQPKPH